MVLTSAQRQRRMREKKKLIVATAAAEAIFSGPGGVDRLSELVNARVTEMVKAGILIPTIADGLRSEKIMADREARVDDRQTAITLAMILSGATAGRPPADILIEDGMTIDGDAEELDDE